jgi:hypothetical protein
LVINKACKKVQRNGNGIAILILNLKTNYCYITDNNPRNYKVELRLNFE